jgi:integrase
MNLLSAVLTTAVKEWEWLAENPCRTIPRPPNSEPRSRRISDDEREAILAALTDHESAVTVGLMFRLALQTAMRQAEICGIRAADFHDDYVHLPRTKNGTARDVPLTIEAQQIVKQLIKRPKLRADNVSQIFRKAVKRAGISDLTFHDARHEATVFLSRKLDVLELAKVGGWRDVKVLLNTYYAVSPSALAAKLR